MTDEARDLRRDLMKTLNSLLESERELEDLIQAVIDGDFPNHAVYLSKYRASLSDLQIVIEDIRTLIADPF